ncbi:MAG: transglycosylase SLT domain-containing protein [Symploca sp. SIO2E9]|nr:transglycosylase SLT domain-containing protein [Symploca sp. SIO2E9]
MLKGQKNKIPVLVGTGIVLSVLLGSSFLAMGMGGLLARWSSSEKTPNTLSLNKEDANSVVLPLVSLPPKQRSSKLELIASGKKSRDQYRARYLLASDLIELQQGEAALAWLEGLELDYPVLASHIAFKRAQAYEVMGEQAQAEQAWKQLLSNYQQQPVAAEALLALGKSNPEYLNQAISQFPSHPRTHEIVRQRLTEDPNQPALLLLLAKHTPKAPGTDSIRNRLVANYASVLTPQEWEVIAQGYWQIGQYKKASEAYAKAPQTPLSAYRVARGLHLSGKKTEARTAYEQLITNFPDSKEIGLGLKHLASLSKSTDALVYLDQIISKFPEQAPEALLAKAKILDRMESPQSATQARKSILTQYADSEVAAEYRWQRAEEKAAEANFEQAWQWAQPITTNNPDSSLAPEAAFWVGRWAAHLGHQKEAKAAFEHVLARYPESYYAWRSAHFLGLDVGDFDTVRWINPQVVRPQARPIPPAGSDSLKELYLLGQDLDAWRIWQLELEDPQQPTVAEQFTDGLIRLAIGDHLKGINQIWSLKRREEPQEQEQWQALRRESAYWQALFPFPFLKEIAYWSEQRKLNPLLVTGLIRQESRFETDIRSVAGATGLMQLMPGTGKWVAQKIDFNEYNLENPNDNIKLGTWYLDYTHQQYNHNSLLAVASYNAGPGNVAKWVEKYGFRDPDTFIERIPFPETKGYVEVVFGNYWNYLRLYDPSLAKKLRKYANHSQTLDLFQKPGTDNGEQGKVDQN